MLIYGTNAKVVEAPGDAEPSSCPSCGEQALRAHVLMRYAHVFWIPFVPIGKKVVFACDHCQLQLEGKKAQPALTPAASAAKAAAKRPFYHFAGVALLAVLVGIGAVQAQKNSRNTEAWVAAPAVGDYYILDGDDLLGGLGDPLLTYVVARVDGVSEDQVDVTLGTYGYSRLSGARQAVEDGDINAADYFAEEPTPLPRSELSAWLDQGDLISVIRR